MVFANQPETEAYVSSKKADKIWETLEKRGDFLSHHSLPDAPDRDGLRDNKSAE